jgi:hypothetical protein
MRVLTVAEQLASATEAHKAARRMVGDRDPAAELGYDQVYAMRFTIEVLARACRDARNPTEPAFKAQRALHNLTTTELETLLAHYEGTVEALDPMHDEVTT